MQGRGTNSIKQALVVTSPSYYLNGHITGGWSNVDTYERHAWVLWNLHGETRLIVKSLKANINSSKLKLKINMNAYLIVLRSSLHSIGHWSSSNKFILSSTRQPTISVLHGAQLTRRLRSLSPHNTMYEPGLFSFRRAGFPLIRAQKLGMTVRWREKARWRTLWVP